MHSTGCYGDASSFSHRFDRKESDDRGAQYGGWKTIGYDDVKRSCNDHGMSYKNKRSERRM